MPRPKTIIVNDPDVLASIAAAFQADREELAAATAEAKATYDNNGDGGRYNCWQTYTGWKRTLDALEAKGTKYDLARFAGRPLTPSERIRRHDSIRRPD